MNIIQVFKDEALSTGKAILGSNSNEFLAMVVGSVLFVAGMVVIVPFVVLFLLGGAVYEIVTDSTGKMLQDYQKTL